MLTSLFARRKPAFLMLVVLGMFVALTDWPANLLGLRAFWLEHALVAGVVVSLLFLTGGYVVLDVSLERAREARDDACIDEIRRGIQHDHLAFWGEYGDIGPTSARRAVLFGDVSDARESAFATHRTLAVWAQLAMQLQSQEGMMIAKNAVGTFGALGSYLDALGQANIRLGIENRSRSQETTMFADKALQVVQDAHAAAHKSYVQLLNATGGKSPIKEP